MLRTLPFASILFLATARKHLRGPALAVHDGVCASDWSHPAANLTGRELDRRFLSRGHLEDGTGRWRDAPPTSLSGLIRIPRGVETENALYFNGRALRVVDADTGSTVVRGLQGSGDLSLNPDGKRILGNFGQPSTLCWVDLESGDITPVMKPARSSVCSDCRPTEITSRDVMTRRRERRANGATRAPGGCLGDSVRRRRADAASPVPVTNLRSLVGRLH